MTQLDKFLQPIQYLFVLFSLAPPEAYYFLRPIPKSKQMLANVQFVTMCLLLTCNTVFFIFYFHYLNLPKDLNYYFIFQTCVSVATIIYLAIVIESKICAKQHLKILQQLHQIDTALGEFDELIDYVAVSSRYTFRIYLQLVCTCVTWIIGACCVYTGSGSLHLCCLVSVAGCSSLPTMTRLTQCSFYLDLIEERLQSVCTIILKSFTCDQSGWDVDRLLKIYKLYNLVWEVWHDLNLLMGPSLIAILSRIMIDAVVDGYMMYVLLIDKFSIVTAVGEYYQ